MLRYKETLIQRNDKGKESDPTNASVDSWPTVDRLWCVGDFENLDTRMASVYLTTNEYNREVSNPKRSAYTFCGK